MNLLFFYSIFGYLIYKPIELLFPNSDKYFLVFDSTFIGTHHFLGINSLGRPMYANVLYGWPMFLYRDGGVFLIAIVGFLIHYLLLKKWNCKFFPLWIVMFKGFIISGPARMPHMSANFTTLFIWSIIFSFIFIKKRSFFNEEV